MESCGGYRPPDVSTRSRSRPAARPQPEALGGDRSHLDSLAMATEPRERTDVERWEREVYARTQERDAPFQTISGVPVKPLYTEVDLPEDLDEAIGLPGEPPFTRSEEHTSEL